MHKILIDDAELFGMMMTDMASQKPIYRPGPYWEQKAKIIAQAIKKMGLKNFRSHTNIAISESYTDVLNLDPTIKWRTRGGVRKFASLLADSHLIRKYIVDQFTNEIKKYQFLAHLYRDFYINNRFGAWLDEITNIYNLPESLVGGCEDIVTIKGAKFSAYYLECIARIYNYASKIDFSAVTSMFEIGGGMGANAHLLMHMFPNIRKYLYLDIPPNLYVGTQYLKYFFPEAVVDYRESTKLENIEFEKNDKREILTIAPWQIEKVNVTVDGVWNSHSFVEMPLTTIQNYGKYIKKFLGERPSSFLCLLTYNLFTDSTICPDKMVEVFRSFLNIEQVQPRVNLQELERQFSFYYLGRQKSI